MEKLIIKNVDVMGDFNTAAKDHEGNVWVGVRWVCDALDMTEGQMKRQIKNIKKDMAFGDGGSNQIPLPTGQGTQEVFCIRNDFIPLWLAKISITQKTREERPEFSKKLLEYQLKAKDILAAAFLPQQDAEPKTPTELLKMHYEAIKFVESKVDGVSERVNELDSKLDSALLDLPILGVEESKINKAVKAKGVQVMGGKNSNAYRNRSIVNSVYRDIYGQIYRNFGVSTYKALKRSQCEKVLEVIHGYVPPVILADRIQNENAQNSLNLEEDKNKT